MTTTETASFIEPGVRIRHLEVHELEALRELDEDVFGVWAYPAFVLRQLFDAHRRFWLVAEGPDGRMRGYTLAVRRSEAKGDAGREPSTAWLFGLGVREEFRRLGCGRLLTDTVLDLLGRNDVEVVKLTVEPDNARAMALYEEFGFVKIGFEKDYFGADEDANGDRVVMEAWLTRPERSWWRRAIRSVVDRARSRIAAVPAVLGRGPALPEEEC